MLRFKLNAILNDPAIALGFSFGVHEIYDGQGADWQAFLQITGSDIIGRIKNPEKMPHMLEELRPFLIHWCITSVSLWVASHIFRGIRFVDTSSLVVSALLLGFANAIVKPLLIVLTLPLTVLTFGLFLLVINALMVLLVSKLVRGFLVSSFWTAFFASMFISVLSFVLGAFFLSGSTSHRIEMPHSGMWL